MQSLIHQDFENVNAARSILPNSRGLTCGQLPRPEKNHALKIYRFLTETHNAFTVNFWIPPGAISSRPQILGAGLIFQYFSAIMPADFKGN